MTVQSLDLGTSAYYWDGPSGQYVPVQYSAGEEVSGIPLGETYEGVLFGSTTLLAVAAGRVVRGYTVRAEVRGGWRWRPPGVGSNPTWLRNGAAAAVALQNVLTGAAGVVLSLPPTGATASNTVTEAPRGYPIGKVPSPAGSLTGASKSAVISAWPAGVGTFNTSPRVGGQALDDYMVQNPSWKNSWTVPSLSVDVTLMLSGVPTRTHAARVEMQADDLEFPVKLAYPDGEPVVGVPVTLRAGGACVAISGDDTYGLYAGAATVTTGADGIAQFGLRSLSAGSDTLHVELQGDWKKYSDLYSPPFGTRPVAVTITAPSPEPKPPTVVTTPSMVCTSIPEQPAVAERSAYVKYESSTGWDAGANSVDQLDGDVELVFSQPPATGVVVGFAMDREDPTDRSRVTHGFFFHRNLAGSPVAQVIESGATKTDEFAHLSTTEWRVQRIGGAVRYLMDGNVIFRSATPSAGVLSVGCSIYASGDEVPSQ